MGVADAGVRAGVSGGADAVAPGIGGTAARFLLNTTTGKKTTRTLSKGTVLAITAPLLAFVLIVGIIGVSIVSIFGGAAGGVAAALGSSLDNCTVYSEDDGSGAGGSVVAYHLAASGARVAVLALCVYR